MRILLTILCFVSLTASAQYRSTPTPRQIWHKPGTDSVFSIVVEGASNQDTTIVGLRFILPSKISQLTNDSNYAKVWQMAAYQPLGDYAITTTVNAKEPIINTGNAAHFWAGNKTFRAIGVSDVTNLPDSLNARVRVSVVGQANGVASLNSLGQVPLTQIPVLGVANTTVYNLAAASSSTSTTPVNVVGWGVPVVATKIYKIEIFGSYQTAATTTGGILGITTTLAAGSVNGELSGHITQSAAASPLRITLRSTSGAGSSLTTTGVGVINSPHYIGGAFTFNCTTTGTLNIVWGSEVAASAAQLNAGSVMVVTQLN